MLSPQDKKSKSIIVSLSKKLSLSDDKLLLGVVLDVTRTLDPTITRYINEYKNTHGIRFNSQVKKRLREHLLGLSEWLEPSLPPIQPLEISEDEYVKALRVIEIGIQRNELSVLGTLRARFSQLRQTHNGMDYSPIIAKRELGLSNLLIIETPGDTAEEIDKVKTTLLQNYRKLANYHFAVLIFRSNNWSGFADVALYAENFMQEHNFKLFNRTSSSKKEELLRFICENKNLKGSTELKDEVNNFYESVSYGFQFQDFLISAVDDTKILILQKIELDDSVLPCPECLSTQVRGNSYPKLLQKSFECHNSDCPTRSKIGRGKRFDYMSIKRNFLIQSKKNENEIPPDLAKAFRRDIFTETKRLHEMILKLFSWHDSRVTYFSAEGKELLNNFGRIVTYENLSDAEVNGHFETPILRLLKAAANDISISPVLPEEVRVDLGYSIVLGNSSRCLSALQEKIANVITSPPYYNAREYSNWPTLVCYLIDMMISARAIYEVLETGGKYFYNIGDIVGQENIFVSSHMSNRRLMLGFYSIALFEAAGFEVAANFIWDKGEVQSKRNSTENLYPTYVKPINCYEHLLGFSKGASAILTDNLILSIEPVRKINSKGENILGHTAPYPEALVDFALTKMEKDLGVVLDPFLGSGTTVIAARALGFNAIGVELDKTYFELASQRIKTELEKRSEGLFQ